MELVRIGIVGLGNMGLFHVGVLNQVKDIKLTAVCSRSASRVAETSAKTGATGFASHQELFASGLIDAVIVATPHQQHAEIALAAFEAGIHVLCEKPIAASLGDARKMIAAAERRPELKFSMMFQMRTHALYKKVRDLIGTGELGELTRVSWLVTDWFRTWRYYASGGWRATWSGEGGGVLTNQCPHNLDLLGWCTGLSASRVTAVASVGKTHPIEVEDEVSAIIEFSNGAVGHFVTTTGEAPGVNRLEICGDRGRLVAEQGKLMFHRTRQSVRAVRETSSEPFAVVETWPVEIPFTGTSADGHNLVTQNFVNAILRDEPLICPGADGVKGLELGAAMQMAGLTRRAVELPIASEAHAAFLTEMDAKYGGRKTLATVEAGPADMSSSFR